MRAGRDTHAAQHAPLVCTRTTRAGCAVRACSSPRSALPVRGSGLERRRLFGCRAYAYALRRPLVGSPALLQFARYAFLVLPMPPVLLLTATCAATLVTDYLAYVRV